MVKKRKLIMDIVDYEGNRICPLYDWRNDISGQAAGICNTSERNGWKTINFSVPSKCEGENGMEDNFRCEYLKPDWRILIEDDNGKDLFTITKTDEAHTAAGKSIAVTAGHVSQILKTKNLGLEFDDKNGDNVGTAKELLTTILDGTGWKPGEVSEFYEKDGITIKKRSMKAGAKTGAFKLIGTMCDLFEAKPVYHGIEKTVDILPMNPFGRRKGSEIPDISTANDVTELHYGVNLKNVKRSINTENITTKLYAYGSFGDNVTGYCGIDVCSHTEYRLTLTANCTKGVPYMYTYVADNGIEVRKHFTPTEDLKTGDVLVYSLLDPASMSYLWNERAQRAYAVVSGGCDNVLPYSSEKSEEQNWFSFLMDFNYYEDSGLMTDEMLQKIALYQRTGAAKYKEVHDAAAVMADSQMVLSETIGSVDFDRISVLKVDKSGPYVRLTLDKSVYDDGVIYRTDYDKTANRRFIWRAVEELNEKGEPKNNVVTSVIYAIKDTDPVQWEKVYLKEIDDKDSPAVLTLWKESSETNMEETDHFFLFQTNNINGRLGVFEASDEAAVLALENALKVVTAKHPVYFSKEAPAIDNGELNGYGWWWQYDTAEESKCWFCYWLNGDREWHRVYNDNSDPGGINEDYWYNWTTAKLYHRENGSWIQVDTTVTKEDYEAEEVSSKLRVVQSFSTVFRSGVTRDRYYKGDWTNYICNVNDVLPAGNYAIQSEFETIWAFTTKDVLTAGDSLTYKTDKGWMTQLHDEVEDTIEVKGYRYDNVLYHPANIFDGTYWKAGSLNRSTGAESTIDTDKWCMSAARIPVYPNTVYETRNGGDRIDIHYYDKNGNWKGCSPDADGNWGTFLTDNTTYFIRICVNQSKMVYEKTKPDIHAKDYADTIVIEEENYRLLDNIVTDGERRGILTYLRKFMEAADRTYIEGYRNMKAAQDIIGAAEAEMNEALGDILREGWWQKQDYVKGDEQKLYDDAIENLEQIAKPVTTYAVDYLDLYGANESILFGANEDTAETYWPEIDTTTAIHLTDQEIDVDEWAYVDKIAKYYDQPWKTKLEINTNLSSTAQHSFSDVMTHIANVAQTVKGMSGVYDRAGSISADGTISGDALSGGVLDTTKIKLSGGEGNWTTDNDGSLIFYSADGQSAMKLSGFGLFISNTKTTDGQWLWETAATGTGINADSIKTGQLDASVIKAGTIEASQVSSQFGSQIDLSSNTSLLMYATADGSKPAGSLTTQGSYIRIGTDSMTIASGGNINVKSGGNLIVESDNLSVNEYMTNIANSGNVMADVYCGPYRALSEGDIVVSDVQPAAKLGRVWIKPNSVSETNVRYMNAKAWPVHSSLLIDRSTTLTLDSDFGPASAASGLSIYTYTLCVPLFIENTDADTETDNATRKLTAVLSSGSNSVMLTATGCGRTVNGIGETMIEMTGTGSVWLGNSSAITCRVHLDEYDKGAESIFTGIEFPMTLRCRATKATASWTDCTVKIYG